MKKALEFYSVDEKMPDKYSDNSTCSDDLICITADGYVRFAHYDFNEHIWNDDTVFDECNGYLIIKDVVKWAYASDLSENKCDKQK